MKRYLPQLVFVLFVVVLAPAALAAEHTKDSLETVKKNLKEKKAVLLDVREQREWDAGHLQQALLVPLSKLRSGTESGLDRQGPQERHHHLLPLPKRRAGAGGHRHRSQARLRHASAQIRLRRFARSGV